MTSYEHSSESNEHFTPAFIVEAASLVLTTFDLDPASCEEANRRIRAERYFTISDSGFKKPWTGRVFLNPPGGFSDAEDRRVIKASKKSKACTVTGACGLPPGHKHEGVEASQKKWWNRLAQEVMTGEVEAAIYICFSLELFQTSQVDAAAGVPLPLDYPFCVASRRVPYDRPGGGKGDSPPHASAIILVCRPAVAMQRGYLGRFRETFGKLGRVVVPGGD